MKDHVLNRILEATGATRIVKTDRIQALWNNYGVLSRVHLEGSAHPSVILKHIQIPNRNTHPRGFGGAVSRQRKIKSYEVETHWYLHQNKEISEGSATPRCIDAFDSGDELFILLEDLSTRGFTQVKGRVTWREMTRCLSWLAHFHGHFLQADADGLWSCGTYWHLATRPDELDEIKGTRLHTFAGLLDARLSQSAFQTIVHGDAKLANFLFTDDSSSVAAVDFQYVGRGCGMKDVAYFVGSCLYDDQCQSKEAAILDFYFSELKAVLAGGEIDFSTLEAEWRSLYPVAWADFQRFMMGWSPGHRKLHGYSRQMTDKAIQHITEDLLDAAISAGSAAAQYIKSNRFRHVEVASKGMASEASDMVTEIDIRAQEIVLEGIEPTFSRYGLGLLAEEGEQDTSRLTSHAFWTIDPLDGTQYFIEGKTGFATSIALVSQAGDSILSVAVDPVTDTVYHAVKGGGFFINGQRHAVETMAQPPAQLTWYADRSLPKHPDYAHYQTQFDLHFIGGAVTNILQVIQTPRSCYFKLPKKTLGGCAIWDIAAVSLMLQECGGIAEFFDGSRLNLNREESIYFNDVGLMLISPDLTPNDILERI